MAWLNIKNPEPEDSSQKVSYDEIALFDFLVTRVRLLVIENRDVISVSLILIMGFAVFWTVRVSGQPVSTNSQAAVTIFIVTPTPSLSPTPTSIPTLPLPWLLTPTPSGVSSSPRPTNPFWEYLK